MLEYASIRFRFVCATPTTVPRIIVAAAITHTTGAQSALNGSNDELRDYAGLWYSHPGLSALMTVCLLSLGGLPPTAGFIGKWYIFSAAVGSGYYGLAIIGVLTSVISVFFYLRVVVMMYMQERGTDAPHIHVNAVSMTALTVSIAAIFYLGILPTQVLNLAAQSIATIF